MSVVACVILYRFTFLHSPEQAWKTGVCGAIAVCTAYIRLRAAFFKEHRR